MTGPGQHAALDARRSLLDHQLILGAREWQMTHPPGCPVWNDEPEPCPIATAIERGVRRMVDEAGRWELVVQVRAVPTLRPRRAPP